MVVTNALGVAFTATLLSVGDSGAVFVFPEDGATNTIALSQLSKESAERVSAAAGYVPVPPALAATYSMARDSLARVAALAADGRLDAAAASERRSRILAAFERACREKGVSPGHTGRLKAKLGY